jgi:hypothetical protein
VRRYANYAKAGIKRGVRGALRRYKVDLELLLKQATISERAQADGLGWMGKATKDELEAERTYLGETYFGGDILADVRADFEHAGVEEIPTAPKR